MTSLPIDLFDTKENYMSCFAKAIADIRGTRKAPGVERIYLPGEREHLCAQQRQRDGIALGAALAKELLALGHQHGVTLDLIG